MSRPKWRNPFENHVVLQPGQLISVKFYVLKGIKGIETSEATIIMRAGSAECCYSFKRTKTYLVFARKYAAQLLTTGCDPDKLVKDLNKDDDVQLLLSMKQGANVEAQKQLCISANAKQD